MPERSDVLAIHHVLDTTSPDAANSTGLDGGQRAAA
jgi:hypothetical protein